MIELKEMLRVNKYLKNNNMRDCLYSGCNKSVTSSNRKVEFCSDKCFKTYVSDLKKLIKTTTNKLKKYSKKENNKLFVGDRAK